MSKQILVCDDEYHADFLDKMVLALLADADNSLASAWSGVLTNGTQYGILWAEPVSSLLQQEAGDLPVIEDVDDEWAALPPPEPSGADQA